MCSTRGIIVVQPTSVTPNTHSSLSACAAVDQTGMTASSLGTNAVFAGHVYRNSSLSSTPTSPAQGPGIRAGGAGPPDEMEAMEVMNRMMFETQIRCKAQIHGKIQAFTISRGSCGGNAGKPIPIVEEVVEMISKIKCLGPSGHHGFGPVVVAWESYRYHCCSLRP
eukprot:1337306-Amphidinium_carterae.1